MLLILVRFYLGMSESEEFLIKCLRDELTVEGKIQVLQQEQTHSTRISVLFTELERMKVMIDLFRVLFLYDQAESLQLK